MNVNIVDIRVFAAVMLCFAVSACGASEEGSQKLSVDLEVGDQATAKALGLPTYPGAKPYKDHKDDESAADIGFSTPLFGLRVVAAKLETPDKPEKVARFYRDALAKYGEVIECPETNEERAASKSDEESDELTCDDTASHSMVYKAGTENNQRIVAIDRHGSGTRFSLVRVDIREDDEE